MNERTGSFLVLGVLTAIGVVGYALVGWAIGPGGPMYGSPMFAKAFLCLVLFVYSLSVFIAYIPDPPSRRDAAAHRRSDSRTSPCSELPSTVRAESRQPDVTLASLDRSTPPPRGRSLSPHPMPRAGRACGELIRDGHRGDQAPAASEIAATTQRSAGAQAGLIPRAAGGSIPPPATTTRRAPRDERGRV